MSELIKIKICGVTRLNDALLASELGAWALGFIFYSDSPRYLEPAQAAQIINRLPSHVKTVGVFVNASRDEMLAMQRRVGFQIFQLHGDESPDLSFEMRSAGPVWKALSIKDESDLEWAGQYNVDALIADSRFPGLPGGTGISCDWNLARRLKYLKNGSRKVILSGGLRPDNFTQAVSKVEPWALDLSSGVETTPGVKDSVLLSSLFKGGNS